jgi:hypothetical protein
VSHILLLQITCTQRKFLTGHQSSLSNNYSLIYTILSIHTEAFEWKHISQVSHGFNSPNTKIAGMNPVRGMLVFARFSVFSADGRGSPGDLKLHPTNGSYRLYKYCNTLHRRDPGQALTTAQIITRKFLLWKGIIIGLRICKQWLYPSLQHHRNSAENYVGRLPNQVASVRFPFIYCDHYLHLYFSASGSEPFCSISGE